MKKKRGNPKKHWTDIARLKIWYNLLVKRSGMNNNRLGQIYGWKKNYSQTSSTERCMTFYRIQSHHQIPKGYDSRWRSMAEIVDAVDLEKNYIGLRQIYISCFWDLLKLNSISFLNLRELIQAFFKKHQINRVDKRKDSDFYQILLTIANEDSIYEKTLQAVLIGLDDIDALELVLLLYLEVKAVELSLVKMLESILDQRINDFFDDMTGNFTQNNFYKNAIDDVRMINVSLEKTDLNKIERLSKECKLPFWVDKVNY